MAIPNPIQEHVSKKADPDVQAQLQELDQKVRQLAARVAEHDKILKALKQKEE